MNKKKVALIDPVGGKAGMDFYDISLLKSLRDLGYETILFGNFDATVPGIQTFHSFNNIGVHKIRAIFNNFIYFIRALIFCKQKKVHWLILHLFRGGLFDLVTIGLARIMGFRILLIIHDIKSLDTIALPFTRRIVLNHFNHTKLVHNRYSYNQLAQEVKPASMGNVQIIPHGNFVELGSQPGKRNAIPELKLEEGKRYLLFFGQLKKVKGLDILIKSLGMAKTSFHLVIAGKGRDDSFSSYQHLVKSQKLENRVTAITRFITNEERDFLMRSCEAIVIPYKRVYQSGVLLMAMSYAKTIIASDLEPIREIIRNEENGLLFESGNPESLARVLEKLYQGDYDVNSLESQAFRTVQEENSWSEIGSNYARILET